MCILGLTRDEADAEAEGIRMHNRKKNDHLRSDTMR